MSRIDLDWHRANPHSRAHEPHQGGLGVMRWMP